MRRVGSSSIGENNCIAALVQACLGLLSLGQWDERLILQKWLLLKASLGILERVTHLDVRQRTVKRWDAIVHP